MGAVHNKIPRRKKMIPDNIRISDFDWADQIHADEGCNCTRTDDDLMCIAYREKLNRENLKQEEIK